MVRRTCGRCPASSCGAPLPSCSAQCITRPCLCARFPPRVTAPPHPTPASTPSSTTAMFGVSAAYHRPTWAPSQRALWRRLDHAAIFLLIAGTNTPLALIALEPAQVGLRKLGLAGWWLVGGPAWLRGQRPACRVGKLHVKREKPCAQGRTDAPPLRELWLAYMPHPPSSPPPLTHPLTHPSPPPPPPPAFVGWRRPRACFPWCGPAPPRACCSACFSRTRPRRWPPCCTSRWAGWRCPLWTTSWRCCRGWTSRSSWLEA